MSHLVEAKGHLKAHIYSEGLIASLVDEICSIPKIQSLKMDPAITQLVTRNRILSASSELKSTADVGEMTLDVLIAVFSLSDEEQSQVRAQLSYIRENKLDKTPSLWKRIRSAIWAFFSKQVNNVAKKSTQLIIRGGINAAINSFQQLVLGNVTYINSIEQLCASLILKFFCMLLQKQ